MTKNLNKVMAIIISALIVLAIIWSYFTFSKLWKDDLIIPSPYVTEVKWLSDYLPSLKGTRGDTRVFIIDSGKPGATMAVNGGTHTEEQSGVMASMVLIEQIKMETGKLVVIPQMNNSSLTHNFPQEATPQFLHFNTKDGQQRVFRGGSRGTNPIDFWPDPEVFNHYPTGQKLAGEEVRNLNRNYPGRPDGHFTERVAYAIMQVLIQEKVDINIDLHEAWPEYPFVNAMGVDDRGADVATIAALELRMEGIDMNVEAVPKNFRGLSYREISEYTDAMAFLTETPNASQGRIRGITSEKLVIEGQDAFYVKASELGRTFVNFDEEGWPLNKRVARQLATVNAIAVAYTELHPDKPIVFANMPSYEEVASTPVGYFLNSPAM